MSTIPPVYGRTTSMLVSSQLLGTLRQTQAELLRSQMQISTGKMVNRPSDAADRASAILYLQQQLSSRGQWTMNLDHALATLNNADQAMGDALAIAREATTVASSQVGVGSDAQTRLAESHVVDAQLQALLDVANRQYNGISLFGGNAGAASGTSGGASGGSGGVFEEFMGGIRYRGSSENLMLDIGSVTGQAFTSNGAAAFGALSTRVKTEVNLGVQAAADTRLADVAGANGQGIRQGSVEVVVNGSVTRLDLSAADNLGDIATRINAAIAESDPAAGSLALTGAGFALTAGAGHTITLREVGTGRTASDLGVDLTVTSGTVSGASVQPKLTARTRLADLGATIDWASGLQVTQGATTKTADFSTCTTVQDMMNVVDGLGLGIRLQVNAEGSGLDLVSEVSGLELSVGENGGTTAQDLGIRTFGTGTKLSDFRHGLGIETVEGAADFAIALHDGTRFEVDITGATTVAEVMSRIEASATAAGVNLGTDFAVGLATTGNGFVFTDNTAGGGEFLIQNVGLSLAADQLGIAGTAGAGSTLQSADVAKVRVESIFTHLIDLRNALQKDDTAGITLAGSHIEKDLEGLTQARAEVGIQARRVEQQQDRSADLQNTEKTMLSNLQDADLTEVITRFTQLQMQLQASLQVGAQNMQLSLLDFLR